MCTPYREVRIPEHSRLCCKMKKYRTHHAHQCSHNSSPQCALSCQSPDSDQKMLHVPSLLSTDHITFSPSILLALSAMTEPDRPAPTMIRLYFFSRPLRPLNSSLLTLCLSSCNVFPVRTHHGSGECSLTSMSSSFLGFPARSCSPLPTWASFRTIWLPSNE